MDIFDQATQQEEMAREAALSIARKPVFKLQAKCICHNCEEVLAEGLIFCDADCRDDWQARVDAK